MTTQVDKNAIITAFKQVYEELSKANELLGGLDARGVQIFQGDSRVFTIQIARFEVGEMRCVLNINPNWAILVDGCHLSGNMPLTSELLELQLGILLENFDKNKKK